MTVAPRFEELQVNPQEFIGFLKRAFAMKRKTLFNNLREKYGKEKIRTALKEAGVRADIRAEAGAAEDDRDLRLALAQRRPGFSGFESPLLRQPSPRIAAGRGLFRRGMAHQVDPHGVQYSGLPKPPNTMHRLFCQG